MTDSIVIDDENDSKNIMNNLENQSELMIRDVADII